MAAHPKERAHLFLICFALAIAKLIFVSQNEILCLQDDSVSYAHQAVAKWSLGLPPGYPLWLNLCAFSGMPQRICIEVLYLLAAFTVAIAAGKWQGVLAGSLLFAFVAFAPFSFFLFDHGLSDAFYVALTVLAFGITFWLLLSETWRGGLALAIALGAVFGVMSFTRNEDPLLALWMLLLLLACAAAWKTWLGPMAATAAVIAACGLAVFALCFSYYLVDGVFARGVAVMPQHSRLLSNLAAIDTGQPQIRYVSVSRKSREMAYAVSPTLAKLQPMIEDGQDVWHRASVDSGIPTGEIGNGWIWHVFNNKMVPYAGSPAAAEAAYKKINSEIEQAFRDGRLKKRFIIHPLLGGDLAELLRQLPGSARGVAATALSAMTQDAHDDGKDTQLFNAVFLRRASLEEGPRVTVEGWAFVASPGRKILSVLIASDSDANPRIESMNRPDVSKFFLPQFGWQPEVSAFRVDLRASAPNKINIAYVLDDGRRVQVPQLTGIGISKPASDVLQGIDVIAPHELAQTSFFLRRQARLVKIANSRNGHRIAIGVVAAAFLMLAIVFVRRRNVPGLKLPAIVFCFSLLLWCARIAFYSVLDAGAWDAQQTRYLAPSNALGAIILALSVVILLRIFKESTGQQLVQDRE